MNKVNRPTILPTALSSAIFLWSGVLALYFLAALLAYLAWCRLSDAGWRLAEPTVTEVETELFRCTLPRSVARYSVEGNCLTVHWNPTNDVPMLMLSAYRAPAVAYCAIDANPMLSAIAVENILRDLGVAQSFGVADRPDVIGVKFLHVKPGVIAAHSLFRYRHGEGLLCVFARGDTYYGLLAYWDSDDARDVEEAMAESRKFFDGLELLASPDRFERPFIDSSTLTATEHAKVVAEAESERMQWRLFADRIATEPERALVEAIRHFRRQLELLSSIREEGGLLASEDFNRYEKLLERRAASVRDWFVQLDKYLAIGDDEAAARQAEFIRRHAILREESLDCRRAATVAAEIAARTAAKNGNGNGR